MYIYGVFNRTLLPFKSQNEIAMFSKLVHSSFTFSLKNLKPNLIFFFSFQNFSVSFDQFYVMLAPNCGQYINKYIMVKFLVNHI